MTHEDIDSALFGVDLYYIDGFFAKRKAITELYQTLLKDLSGIHFLPDMEGVTHGHSYFPIMIDEIGRAHV